MSERFRALPSDNFDAIIVGAGLGGYIYFVESERPAGGLETKEKVFTVEADALEELTVTSQGETTTLRKESGTWKITSPIAADADANEVSSLTSALTSLGTDKFAALSTDQLPAFTTGQVRALTTTQVNSLGSEQLNALASDRFAALNTAQVAAFNTTQVAGLETADFVASHTSSLAVAATCVIESRGPADALPVTSCQRSSRAKNKEPRPSSSHSAPPMRAVRCSCG